MSDTSEIPAPATGSHAAPELAAFVQALYDAYDRGDVRPLARALAPDCRLMDETTGRWAYGPREIIARARAERRSADRFHNWIDEIDSRWIAPDVALMTFVWHADARWNEKDYLIRCPTSVVARRQDDTWQVLLIHSVPVDEAVAEAREEDPL